MNYEKETEAFIKEHLLTDNDITEDILKQMSEGEGIIITTENGKIIDIDASWAECDGYEDCWNVRVYESYEQYAKCGYTVLWDSVRMIDFTINHILNYMTY